MSETLMLFDQPQPTITGIRPRDYQTRDIVETYKLWDAGEVGVLTRAFTGSGKTLMSAWKIQQWLERSTDHRAMVLSYEQELVWQFAQEVEDYIGIKPGIEMGRDEIEPGKIPQVVVASRQSLMTHELATQEQRDVLAQHGLRDIGLLTKAAARRIINALNKEADVQQIADGIADFQLDYRCNHQIGRFSRLYKFDFAYHWLLIMDECVDGNSVIITEFGPTMLKDASRCKFVQSWDGHRIVMNRILRFWNKSSKRVVKITTTDGGTLRCTKDHLVLTSRGWVEAGTLDQNSYLLATDIPSPNTDTNSYGYAGSFHTANADVGEECSFTSADRHLRNGARAAEALCTANSFEGIEPESRRRFFPLHSRKNEQFSELCSGTQASVTHTPVHSLRDLLPITADHKNNGPDIRLIICCGLERLLHVHQTADLERHLLDSQLGVIRHSSASLGWFGQMEGRRLLQRNGLIELDQWGLLGGTAMTDLAEARVDYCCIPKDGMSNQSRPFMHGSNATLDAHRFFDQADIPSSAFTSQRLNEYSAEYPGMSQNACDTNCGKWTRVASIVNDGVADVFDIEVEGSHSFFANGILVHNCHKYKMEHVTCGHLIEWFERNPHHRRSGITATPQRSDKVSIGTKLFPGIAIDFPLRRAVTEGYAVPYLQKFIQVEAIDFKRIKEESHGSDKQWDASVAAAIEGDLAKLCIPLLDWCGDRPTLIFSPSVNIALNVAAFINARARCQCECGKKKWYPIELLGQTICECGRIVQASMAIGDFSAVKAACVHGEVPSDMRRGIYSRHKNGDFQFLSVCSLCKEGYNDRNIACVACFRPVSKDAASLAEQMKGRGSRPLKGCIDHLNSKEARLAAIANSNKSDCMIIDLVGVTGLRDCASTVQIYAEGLPDAVVARAEEINLFGGVDDPAEAIAQAKREADEKERVDRQHAAEMAERRRELEAGRRSRLDAEVTYSATERGLVDPGTRIKGQATEKQINFIHFLGMDFNVPLSTRQAGRIIDFLKQGMTQEETAYRNGMDQEAWKPARANQKQQRKLRSMGVRDAANLTPKEAADEFERIKNPGKFPDNPVLIKTAQHSLNACGSQEDLTATAKRFAASRTDFSEKDWKIVVAMGKRRREELNAF